MQTAKQHRLRRIWKRKYDAANRMSRDAGKEINKKNKITGTGEFCNRLKSEGYPTFYLLSKGGHMQFYARKTFEPFK